MSKHVLIIDNHVKTRGEMLQLFTELGCETMTTRDEETGLAAAQCGEFDLVILGADMHPSAGCELLKTLKEHNPDLVVLSMNGSNGHAPAKEIEQILVQTAMQLQPEPPPDPGAPYPVQSSLRDVERIHIERVLEYKKWNQSVAAQALGIDRKTLRNKMREFRLDRP